jgi:hypothetical protein
MHTLGQLQGGGVILEVAAEDAAAIRAAVPVLERLLEAVGRKVTLQVADVKKEAAPVKKEPLVFGPGSRETERPRVVAENASRRVLACKGCGADRATTPWPGRGGGICVECDRARQREEYRKKYGVKEKAAPVVKLEEKPVVKVLPAASSGVERVRRAMSRVRGLESDGGLPRDATGRCVPLLGVDV